MQMWTIYMTLTMVCGTCGWGWRSARLDRTVPATRPCCCLAHGLLPRPAGSTLVHIQILSLCLCARGRELIIFLCRNMPHYPSLMYTQTRLLLLGLVAAFTCWGRHKRRLFGAGSNQPLDDINLLQQQLHSVHVLRLTRHIHRPEL